MLSALADLLQELHSPVSLRARIIVALLGAVIFSSLALTVIAGLLVTGVLRPLKATESIDLSRFLGSAQTIDFTSSDGRTHTGWFFPGLRGAPVIVICHGYKSSRAEILTIATSLQQHRYNVFTFNLAGHGDSPVAYTTLGYRETEELLAALQMLSTRTDIDSNRIGIWGQSLGAYAALTVAPQMTSVRAIALDSTYPRPEFLLERELYRGPATQIPLLLSVARLEFDVVSSFFGDHPEAADSLDRLAGVPKMFILSSDKPILADATRRLFDQAPGPKEIEVRPRTSLNLLIEEERRVDETLLVRFFHGTCPWWPPLVPSRICMFLVGQSNGVG
ncbi:MAG: alpha/beta hydrolase [Terriglobia bacterium]